MRVLIVDDERPARTKLRRYLASEPDVELVGEASCGLDAVAAIRALRPDLVFLDVQMPDLDGFGVVAELDPVTSPRIVFVTAHDAYAVKAFEIHALDYVLKPVGPDRFAIVLERARRDLERGAVPDLSRFVEATRPKSVARLLVQDEERGILLDVAHIDRIDAARNYVSIATGGASYRLRGTLDAVERRLDAAVFVRVNRSTIVRIEAIREVHPWFHGEYRVVLAGGATLTWTRTYLDRVPSVFLKAL